MPSDGVEFFGKGSGGIFGSTRYEQALTENRGKVLRIQARALMGGVEIKRV
ncbi:MAG: hypothetical protein KGZ63_04770 [Clostridiales bacterium]|nr:hypothetical protein [Clostridiales bacterium]